MSLKIDLRAGEKIYIGSSVLTVVSDERTTIIIDGNLPVVREGDFIQGNEVSTPLLRLARSVQLHYLSPHEYSMCAIFEIYLNNEWNSAGIADAMKFVAQGQLYKAVRTLRGVLKIEHGQLDSR